MECAICLEPLETSNFCSLPGCNHSFHVSCILSNAQYDTKCPLCREKIPNIHEKEENSSDSVTASLESLYNDYQRNRRRYLAKKRKLLKDNQRISILETKVKESEKTLKGIEKSLDKMWNEKTKCLWLQDEDLTKLKKELTKTRQKYNRLNGLLNKRLKANLGAVPQFEEGFGYILQLMN